MGTATKTNEKKSKGLSFWTTGENMTEIIRSAWVEDNAKLAMNLCKDMGMNNEQALLTITGKKKLVGDTRENPDLDWVDDNQESLHGIALSLDAMIERLEKQYIKANEDVNLLNGYIESDDSKSDEFAYDMQTLNGYKNKLPLILEQISVVYPLVKKSMKDLPSKEIRSSSQQKKDYRKDNPKEFEQEKVIRLTDFESKLKKVMDNTQGAILRNMEDKKSKEELDTLNLSILSNVNPEFGDIIKEKTYNESTRVLIDETFSRIVESENIDSENLSEKELADIDARAKKEVLNSADMNLPFYTNIGGGASFFIGHCDTEKCKKEGLHAGWLLPDGTFYGGDGIWIHRGIIDELFELDYFKDKNIRADEDGVSEEGGWIKFSGGTWFIWGHKNKLTSEQVEFIIQYTTEVDKSTYFKVGTSTLIHVSVFAKVLNGEPFDEWEMKKESDPIIKAEREARNNDKNNELANFPTVDEIGEIDVLSSPFFMPDVQFVKWIVAYAAGRLIVDCGAGSGYLTALINHLGGKCIGIEPHYTMERREFWNRQGFHFHIFYENAEVSPVLQQSPENGMLLLFARPCHSGFVYRTIKENMPKGTEALYISHEGNEKLDLGEFKYTKLKHEGTSKNNEYVLSVKK